MSSEGDEHSLCSASAQPRVLCPACEASILTLDARRCTRCGFEALRVGRILIIDHSVNDQDYGRHLIPVLASAEREHFWLTLRNNWIVGMMQELEWPGVGRPQIVEIGSGTGFVGLEFVTARYLFGLAVLPMLVQRWVHGRLQTSNSIETYLRKPPWLLNGLFNAVGETERWLAMHGGLRLPFGTSLLAVGRRPQAAE